MKTPGLHAACATVWVTPYLGKAIVHFRNLRGMTQKELAQAAGLDLSAIKRLEAGRKQGGWVMSVEVVCRALGVTLEQLFHQAQHLAQVEAMEAFFLKFYKEASC
ncbi:MAG: helix-turn-helix transcriptional regulator [Verrucomicrobiaceae bacterium]|nr:helix-turn-helix transcriptional regulator [Verrucomicrobiaceae bacterium]